ncbi:MAG: hypothetical protein Q8T09_01005 [Candidatus Melainabacteria bacterium]|nr:hypothetical protein [Candidatus Melainabacteria bacterium]
MLANISAFLSKVAFVMILLFIGLLPDAIFFAAAAQANPVKTTQNSPVRSASVYCVRGTVTVKGWEQDLVKRNPGLRRFNWSPVTAAKPSVLVFRQPAPNQVRSGQTVKQYHYIKPIVLSFAETRPVRKEQKTQEEKAVEAQLVSTYTGASLKYPASYSAFDNQRKVHGRLISSHF